MVDGSADVVAFSVVATWVAAFVRRDYVGCLGLCFHTVIYDTTVYKHIVPYIMVSGDKPNMVYDNTLYMRRKQVTVTIKQEVYDRLREQATSERRGISNMLEVILEERFATTPK